MSKAAQPLPSATSSLGSRDGAASAKPLTAKQQAIWDLVRPVGDGGQGKTYGEAAAIVGISKPVVSKTLQAVYKKLGIKSKDKERPFNQRGAEFKDPEKFAAVLDAAAHTNLETLAAALRDSGVPERAAASIIKRIQTRFYGAVSATKNLKTQEILDMLGNRIHLALQYMDDKVMGEASFRDLALGTTAMIEKRQLLRGEPTAIISDAERAKLHELLPLAIAEARRRGLTVEGQVTERQIEPA